MMGVLSSLFPEFSVIGYLLLVPVASWGLMLVVGSIKGLGVGITLDLYTNWFIALTFVFIGLLLKKGRAK